MNQKLVIKTQKKSILQTFIGNCHTVWKNVPHGSSQLNLSPRKAMSQSPYFDIKYWRSYRPFHSKILQLITIKNYYIYCVGLLNACYIVQKTKPLAWLSTAELQPWRLFMCLLIFIHYSLSILLLEFTMVIFFIFLFTSKKCKKNKKKLLPLHDTPPCQCS